MGPEDLKLLRETYRLAKENNKMLHKMRRQAFVHTVVWLIIYAALIIAPVWFYMTYLDGAVAQILKAYDALQGKGSQTEQQYEAIHQSLENLREKLPGMNNETATSTH